MKTSQFPTCFRNISSSNRFFLRENRSDQKKLCSQTCLLLRKVNFKQSANKQTTLFRTISQISACNVNPCLNSGTCTPSTTLPGFTCACVAPYSGAVCQVLRILFFFSLWEIRLTLSRGKHALKNEVKFLRRWSCSIWD